MFSGVADSEIGQFGRRQYRKAKYGLADTPQAKSYGE
jgi:hypothetical protein